MLVWKAVPSTVQITINASPLALATMTETIATAPVGPAQFKVMGAAQLIVGAELLLTVTVVEQLAEQPLLSVTITLIGCVPTEKKLVSETSVPAGGLPAATKLVCRSVPSTVQTTIRALLSMS